VAIIAHSKGDHRVRGDNVNDENRADINQALPRSDLRLRMGDLGPGTLKRARPETDRPISIVENVEARACSGALLRSTTPIMMHDVL